MFGGGRMSYSKGEKWRVNKEILVKAKQRGLCIGFVKIGDKLVDIRER